LNAFDPDSQKLKKRVIYAWNYVEWGGAQIYTVALIREARKYYDVLVVLPHGSSDEFIQLLDEEGIVHEFFEPKADLDPATTISRKFRRHLRKIRSEAALVRHLLKKDLRESILHIDFTPQQSFLSLLRLCRHTQVFFTMHNSLPKFSRLKETVWAAKIRALTGTGHFHMFCANENAKDYLRLFVSDKDADSITVTRAGIDPKAISDALGASFDRNKLVDKFEFPRKKTIVLTVGQFIDRKGRWPYLETIRTICQKRKDILFIWLMPKLPIDSDKAKIDEYEVNENFKIVLSSDVGIRRSDILQFFRVADIYVLPSFVEGVPISLLEAMAIGLPSISTRINGIPEAIESGKTGLLVAPGDTVELKKAIVRLVDDPALRKEFAAHGQAFVLSTFDELSAAGAAVTEYQKFLG